MMHASRTFLSVQPYLDITYERGALWVFLARSPCCFEVSLAPAASGTLRS